MNIQDMSLATNQSSKEEGDFTCDDSSSSDREAISKLHPVMELTGNIEVFENGRLTGWAIDICNASKPVELEVYENNRKIGDGIANLFREDLKTSGIGSGNHGFSIPLESVIADGETHKVQVIESNTSTLLNSFEFVSEAFAAAKIDCIEGGSVNGTIFLKNPDGTGGFDIELLANGEICQVGVCGLVEGGAYKFRVPIPETHYDGNYYLYSVQLKSLPTKSNCVYEKLNSVLTPWKYLSHDITEKSLSTLSKVAGYRYEAIQAHLRNHESHGTSIKDVMTAHDVLVEGYEDRRKYPILKLPDVSNPEISIIIPKYKLLSLTYNCIAAIILASTTPNYEVIVIDDCPEDETESLAEYVENLVFIKNDENLGFLRSCNSASEVAKGEYLVFLNNDTEVTVGWLDSLSFVFNTFQDVGMVGSKLIYPDGRLQEAGGIVWGNGKPWNIGNLANADDPRYSYTRQADYLSGAAFMISAKVWREIGMFSSEYIPAYYEDTDLAFKVRKSGLKTFFCAESVVVHFEGMSNGRDLDSGIKKHQTINAPKFRAKWRSAYKHNGVEGKNLQLEKDRNIDFRVLMIDYSTPRPDQDAGGYAAIQEMTLLQDLGCKVTFLPNNMAHMGSYTYDLQRRGVECIHSPFSMNAVDFVKERGMEFDLVYITRYDVAEDVLESIKKHTSAKLVLNNADLHFLRELRAALSSNNDPLDIPFQTRERELSVMRSVDAILSYNDIEHSVIASHNMETENIFKCPWVLSKKPAPVSFEKRNGIAFLGGFNHLPNREAVIYFVDNVMPGLRERLPDVEFNIYGSKVTPEIEQLAGDGVVVKGYVKSLADVFDNCRVFVAPLLSGAGIKGKVLESISYGVPCVLSPVAVESTGLVHGVSTLVAESNEDWIEYIARLYNDEKLWNETSISSGSLVDSLYSHENGIENMRQMMSYLELDPSLDSTSVFKRVA